MLASLLKARINVDAEAHTAATSELNLRPAPTDRQASAGNYKKGHITISGLRIAIENPMGSRRRPEWPELTAHYGYVKGSEGADGDAVDVFVRNATPDDWKGTVYVINQFKEDGSFDEHKVMLGWDSQRDAVSAYIGNYPRGWKVGPVVAMSWADFRAWLKSGDTTQPLADDVAKTWAQSASATSGITAYTTGRARRRKNLYSTPV